jgi:hypothetical protein
MFRKSTVIVVGAGSSAELGLPTGATLRDQISEAVCIRYHRHSSMQASGDEELLRQLRAKFKEQDKINAYTTAANEIAATISSFVSIDEALHFWSARPEIVELGKLAIARKILEAEHGSSIAKRNDRGHLSIEEGDKTWIGEFLTMALSALKHEEIETAFKNVTLINFNYDRIVEQYLYWALQKRAKATRESARAAVAALDAIRPYGSVGPLDWQEHEGTPFGGSDRGDDLFKIAERILTYTEQRTETHVEQRIDAALETAELIMFLGFGYHSQNMGLLVPRSGSTRGKMRKVFGTVMGIDVGNYEDLIEALENSYGLRQRAHLVPCTAARLLSDLRPSIMMAVG